MLQLSYHSTGYIAGSLLSTGLFVYLISLRGKSRQTWYLAIYFCLAMCLNLGFVLRTGIFIPDFAKPSSYLIALYTAFSSVALLLFVYDFPRNRHSFETKIVMPIALLLGLISYGLYIRRTLDAPVRYNFETLFFEFQDPSAAGPMGLLLLSGFLWSLVVVIRKIIAEERLHRKTIGPPAGGDGRIVFSYLNLESKEARALRAFGLAIFFNMLFSLSYLAYTQGLLAYADFQHVLTAATAIQLFLYAIIYLNNSPQPTSFMVKLVGVALVAVLLVLGLVNRITFAYNERIYEQSRLQYLPLVAESLQTGDFARLPEEVRFVVRRPVADGRNYRLLFTRESNLRDSAQFNENDENRQREQERKKTPDRLETPVSSAAFGPVLRSCRAFAPTHPDFFYTTFTFEWANESFEVGFPYAPYRQLVHLAAGQMALLLIGTSAVLVFAFPFFLRGGVVQPLNVLLGGVRRVNAGDYGARIPVQVEDEIGFLGHSFNMMVSSIEKANRDLTGYADKLETRVLERTAELQHTLEEVQKLKIQQDADYWLMSHLVHPLGENRVDSKFVQVHFFMRQRKKFHYERWSGEIGGDICVAHTIFLRGKRYAVIVNADAMGKSIQGAGGALVLGSVFDAIIKRTERSSMIQAQFPERWLKNSFIELSNVFSSFQGTMLVSVLIGLVDEETGLLYYMQAEHPHLFLFRGGAANMVRATFHYPKLGRPYEESQLFINTLQLETGDFVFIGSDGREDILIRDDRGEENVQEDEFFFGRCIVASDGDLEQIYRTIENAGTLIDDLSLIRIIYSGVRRPATEVLEQTRRTLEIVREFLHREEYERAAGTLIAALETDPEDRRVLRQLVNTLLKNRDYERAVQFALRYSRLEPGHVETLFVISRCYHKLGDLAQAADFGERVRLRTPDHIKNLLHLIEVHLEMGEKERARALLREVHLRDPGNPFLTDGPFPVLN